jgi:osmotically-inducible protein OsmY
MIAELALDRLRHSRYLALRKIGCEASDGVLTLRGCVNSYYLKQIAQMSVADLDGVKGIVNEIEVKADRLSDGSISPQELE